VDVITDVHDMKAYVREIHAMGETLCLVPTMGYLHEGHLDLMRRGRTLADHVIISIFVNPTQFGPHEDLDTYPRDFARDEKLAESVGVECIFFPGVQEMYPQGYATYVNVEQITEGLCGAGRPGHFRGVATVCAKLFNICDPDCAVFGEKDYQQLAVIRRMVDDLNMRVQIIAHPTVREADGLAMSSRNKYLSPEQRRNATVLNRVLIQAQELVKAGEHDTAAIRQKTIELIRSTPEVVIDYVEIVHPETLACLDMIEDQAVMALAVKVGPTRLIDNMTLEA